MRDRESFEAEIARLLPVEHAGGADSEVVTESVVRGTTLYLPLVLSAAVKRVGAFVPPAAGTAATVDVIVYFHGHAIEACGTNTDRFRKGGMQYYWNTPLFRCLRRDLAASGRCAVLLAPAMHPFVGRDLGAAGYGELNEDGKFDALVTRALTLLKDRDALAKGATVGNVVLAGHSGGGQPINAVLKAKNTLKPRIRAVWGFECLYFGTATLDAWLARDPDVRFRHYRRKGWKQARVEQLTDNANCIDTASASSHCKSVDEFWGKAIALMPSTPGSQQSYEVQYERPDPDTGDAAFTLSDAELRPTALKLVNKGNESAWKKYADAIKADPKQTKVKKPAFVQVEQAPSESLPTMVREARELARKEGKNDLVALLDPDKWFSKFTQFEWLGRPFKGDQYVHVELAKLMKKIEADLMATVGETDAKKAGDILLNNSNEPIRGSRKQSGTAAVSMHLFGLAVDVNYLSSPYIESDNDNYIMSLVLARASALLRNAAVGYSHFEESVASQKRRAAQLKAKKKQSDPDGIWVRDATSYDALERVDQLLQDYFALLDDRATLRARLAAAASTSHWKDQSEADAQARIQEDLDKLSTALERRSRDTSVKVGRKYKTVIEDLRPYFKLHGILDFDKRFVEGMTKGGLTWGAGYGDLMHFDMRYKGVGKYIQMARNGYLGRAKAQLKRHMDAGEYGYHAFEG